MKDNFEFDRNNIPASIAIIMDGNGRWAQERGLPRSSGHIQGVENVTRITLECARLGVKYLTIYAFSTENWNRPESEVSTLMQLVADKLDATAEGTQLKDPYGIKSAMFKNKDCYSFAMFFITYDMFPKYRKCNN